MLYLKDALKYEYKYNQLIYFKDGLKYRYKYNQLLYFKDGMAKAASPHSHFLPSFKGTGWGSTAIWKHLSFYDELMMNILWLSSTQNPRAATSIELLGRKISEVETLVPSGRWFLTIIIIIMNIIIIIFVCFWKQKFCISNVVGFKSFPARD